MTGQKQQPLRYRIIASPIGDLTLAASPLGLTDISFSPVADLPSLSSSSQLKEARRKRKYEDEPSAPEHHLDHAERQLGEYFARERRSFALTLDVNPHLEQRGMPIFTTTVQLSLLGIPYGQTASYSEVAEMAGAPRAARAVGTACAKNRLPIVLPCHRVVRSDGTVGQYGGDSNVKEYLLNLERG